MRKRKPTQRPRSQASNWQPRSILLAFDWFDQRIYEGIFRFAKERAWHLSPYLVSQRSTPTNWPGDGAITCFAKKIAQRIRALHMPKVDISVAPIPQRVPRVVVDNSAIGRLAAEHFLERGFHDFAFYSWPLVYVNQVRREAFFKALAAAGVRRRNIHEIHQSPARLLGNWKVHEADIKRQLDKLPRPLAVFAGQDNLGANLIEICHWSGISIPEEVAVLGVDNIELLCRGMMVPMSSIDTRLDELGYAAAEQLERLMDGKLKNTAAPILIPPKGVVTRRSTDVLAVRHSSIVRALAFMKEHSHRPITLGQISERVGMSKRGLEKAFLKHLGSTPAEQLRHLRLAKAKKLLVETDEKIEAIAHECGYSNSSNLGLAFNRDCGMSPRAYRATYRRDGVGA
jgi:LacI family transcriptional regulator